jgi:hypothetical protein
MKQASTITTAPAMATGCGTCRSSTAASTAPTTGSAVARVLAVTAPTRATPAEKRVIGSTEQHSTMNASHPTPGSPGMAKRTPQTKAAISQAMPSPALWQVVAVADGSLRSTRVQPTRIPA